MEKAQHFYKMSVTTGTQGVKSHMTWIIKTNHCEELKSSTFERTQNDHFYNLCHVAQKHILLQILYICYKNMA
jgi:hypothetical protein